MPALTVAQKQKMKKIEHIAAELFVRSMAEQKPSDFSSAAYTGAVKKIAEKSALAATLFVESIDEVIRGMVVKMGGNPDDPA